MRQGFTGTELLLFGAILDPEGTPRRRRTTTSSSCSRARPVDRAARESRRSPGIWINADSAEFRSAPTFFAVASSRPIAEIVDERTAAIYELGLRGCSSRRSARSIPREQTRFSAGLVDLMQPPGALPAERDAVTSAARCSTRRGSRCPRRVQTGAYTAETFAISRGKVVASADHGRGAQAGFERFVARGRPAGAVVRAVRGAMSVSMGWIAGRLFALV